MPKALPRERNRSLRRGFLLGVQETELRFTIRKLKSGEYRLYSKKTDPKTGKRRNLGTFSSRAAAEKHEKDIQYCTGM
jgi:hypothetical protein